MRKYLAWMALLLLIVPANAMAAPDISGTWQGEGARRHVLKVTKMPNGELRGDFYNLGRERPPKSSTGTPFLQSTSPVTWLISPLTGP